MGKCLQCGLEVPEGYRFCSRSCSAKYNNSRRERKPWTEEQRQKVRKVKHCRYCGVEITKGHCCKECLEGVRGIPIHTKLGICTGNLKERDERAFQILSDMYFKQNLGVIDIAKQTGIRHASLLSLFRRHGVDKIRGVSEGLRAAIVSGRYLPNEENGWGTPGEHTAWDGYKFRYRSGYELRYAQQLDEQKITYRYESLRIPYYDSSRKVRRVAIPDFYLPETNELVEVKSSWTLRGKEQELRDKFQEYQALGYTPKLLLEGKEYAGMV